MKRRSLLKSAALLPAAGAVPSPAQTQAAGAEFPKLDTTGLDAVAQPVARFFTEEQLSALRKLGDIFVPAYNGRPGATDARAAEFLDLYISQSNAERQKLYRGGLDRLNADASKAHGKGFADLTAAQAAPILKPVTGAWTYAGPSDAFAQFLVAAKEDLLRATVNSRPYSEAAAATGRSGAGTGYYWPPLD